MTMPTAARPRTTCSGFIVAIVAVLTAALMLSACGSSSESPEQSDADSRAESQSTADASTSQLTISEAVVGETVTMSAAVYLDIENHSDETILLIDADCDCSDLAVIHATHHDGGLAQMVHIEEIEIPAQSTVSLHPAGEHIMLETITRELVAGETIELRLGFDSGEEQTVIVPVVPLADLAERVPQ